MDDEDWREGGFGIYLHWPFCEAKCPYCDFNSFVTAGVNHAKWTAAYLAEIDRYAAVVPGRVLNSVFFGGGTPSLMEPDTVFAVLERIKSHWSPANDLEITLEANPTSVEARRFEAFAQAGVNRISMGVQALNDHDLQRLGRLHSTRDARQAFDIAKKNFNRVSFDLMYARQNQTAEDWREELSEAIDMAVDHLSLYQLTIEPGTVFGARYDRGALRGLPDEDRAAEMYDLTQDICDSAGYSAYEVSNHAKPGAASRHNLIYWRYGDFIGIGPGAHGRVTIDGRRYATETVKNPERWLKSVDQSNSEISRHVIAQTEQAQEYMLMTMRLSEGLSLSRFTKLAGYPLAMEAVGSMVDLGMVTLENDRIKATQKGRVVLNAVIANLLPDHEPISPPSGLMSGSGTDHLADQNHYTK
ncbi:MAG: radical SAM family heme chaperone HemW [Pseudomonadota bacterium]